MENREIRILPGNIANMIAAGEVVQRPASVVKELMENAVDAGATQVSVIILDAGRTLIQVIDNGCGMSPDQAVLAFERHATSKIATADDLADIRSYGFRGEALASIAAVSEVTLRTRREADELGCQVDFAASRHISTVETATPVGSNFSVRNLFYNVPARRKFLKSDSVEFKHIAAEFQHIAYTRPEVAFTLLHNGREVYVLKAAKSLKFRVQDIAGQGVASELVDMSAETSVVRIGGFIGRPDKARKGLANQLFFVNGRYFRSPYLHKAVMKGYENMLPEGSNPTYFIYLETDPRSIDVNIHPQKYEIKFEDDSIVFQTLYACVRETLGRSSFGASIDFDLASAPQMPTIGRNFEEYGEIREPVVTESGYNPFEHDGFDAPARKGGLATGGPGGDGSGGNVSYGSDGNLGGNGSYGPSDSGRGGSQFYRPSDFVDRGDDYGRLFEEKYNVAKTYLTVRDRYIVTESKSGLMVVNAKRAMERVLYDRFLAARQNAGPERSSQTMLFPVAVRVGAENVPLIEENAALLSDYGFDIAAFGTDTVVVNAVPAGYAADESSVQTMVGDLLLLLQDGAASVPGVAASDFAEKFALLGASGYGGAHTQDEAQRLMTALLASSNPEYTASGRKIMVIIPSDEIDRKF